jgi:SOS-response transcriptional repressor LexA
VPASLGAGPRTYTMTVRDDSMSGDGIRNGDVILVDPDALAEDGDIAVVGLVWNGVQGRVLRRLWCGGWLLESSCPEHPPMLLSEQNTPRVEGLVVAVIKPV